MIDWTPLDAALERRSPTLWWRDDDAIEATPQLERLMALTASIEARLTLAVIPAHASETLAGAIANHPVEVAVHGWSHTNHAPADSKKAEFGPHRPLSNMAVEVARGKDKLSAMFGEQALPLFIPPWNRMADGLPAELEAQGFKAVSAYAQRAPSCEPIIRIDAHIDPIDWRGTRSAVSAPPLIAHVCALLQDDAPIGLMTHHLVHDDAIWDLTEQLVTRLTRGGAQWVSPGHLMTRQRAKGS